jgi:hypothetical protein
MEWEKMDAVQKSPKRTNIHRKAILRFAPARTTSVDMIRFGGDINYWSRIEGETVELSWSAGQNCQADLVVADGIRSSAKVAHWWQHLALPRLYCILEFVLSCSTVLIVRYWTRLRYFKLLTVMNEFTLWFKISNVKLSHVRRRS